jgi:hypothetical protein
MHHLQGILYKFLAPRQHTQNQILRKSRRMVHVLRERCRVYSVSVHYVCHAMVYPHVRATFFSTRILRFTKRNSIHEDLETIGYIYH